MKKTLMEIVDVKTFATRHPWLFTGSAVAIGFVAGAVLTTSPEAERDGHRPGSSARGRSAEQAGETRQTRTSFLLAGMGSVVAVILKTVVQGLLASAVINKDRTEPRAPADPAGMPECETGSG